MKRRVDEGEWIEFQWPYLMTLLGGEARVNELAYETGAFTRARKIASPSVVLRLLLTWAVGERSLMETAALAAEADIADVSDVALLKRFAKAGEWLGALLGSMLTDRQSSFPTTMRVRVVDATSVTRPGRRGIDQRIHLGMDLGTHRVDSIEVTSAKQGESLDRFEFRAGEIVLADRGYGQRCGLARVARAGAFFVVRFAWSNLPLETEGGEQFDLFAALRSLPEAEGAEFPAYFRSAEGERIAARLVAIGKSEAAAQESRRVALAERRKHGAIEARTLEAAGYFFVLTNLPMEISADSVLQLYRFRWQIEMKFKTLKSVFRLGDVPTRGEQTLYVYLMAKLLVAILLEDLIYQADSFSPWGYPITATQPVAPDPAAA
jgi:IS4 transposase